jgi:hypothetical protein
VTKDLRERFPLPRNILHTHGVTPMGLRGSDRIQWYGGIQRMTEAGYPFFFQPNGCHGSLAYPMTGRDTAKSGIGQ